MKDANEFEAGGKSDIAESDLVFAMGIRFWSDLVVTQNIIDTKICAQVLQELNLALQGKQNCEKISDTAKSEKVFELEYGTIFHVEDFEEKHPLLEAQLTPDIFPKEISRKYKCKFCDWHTNLFETLKKHMNQNHNDHFQTFLKENGLLEKCQFCEYMFISFGQLKEHVLTVHPDDFPDFEKEHRIYNCTICDKKFFTSKKAAEHRRKVHKIRKAGKNEHSLVNGTGIKICDECQVSFTNVNKYIDHKKMHGLGKKPYTCYECGDDFSFRASLTSHIRSHYRVNENVLCDDCGESFEGNNLLTKHIKKIHKKKEVTLKEIKSDEYFCDECGAKVGTKSAYTYHMITNHRGDELICEICSYKTRHKTKMQMHGESHSTPSLPCTECGKLFKGPLYLSRHMKSIHSDPKERPFQCKDCGKGFTIRATFDGHMNMHRGIKPYDCSFCGTQFQNQSNKLAHLKKVHAELYANSY